MTKAVIGLPQHQQEYHTHYSGLLLYSGGIMAHGILTVKIESDTERLVTTYAIDERLKSTQSTPSTITIKSEKVNLTVAVQPNIFLKKVR